ncbi:MAG: DUF1343 domain-containing protein [Chloroflexi bacterium]|uniref:DUF1343 domain-containing protein n=1 Tax=Candidatus Chlorohelix allophototropha TaxID=3003348 RepID=A0A8T7M7G0_9CHLR|nr:DUF1343 domain-containing protein [Chloroflexota bacterium]WJW68016.1 DUF1343 domain-containing protein [Chloroflexota bacterium L227-S17]
MTVRSGLDALTAQLVHGKRLGLVTNQTGVDCNLRRSAEVITTLGGKVAAIFGPEHGYYGVEQDALPVEGQEIDRFSGAPVYSLYRQHDYELGNATNPFAPPAGSLEELDALVFDIQDVGTRYYTYPTTLGILMEQVALPLLVIDRPNPLGGEIIEGPLLEEQFSSFVGRYPLSVRHGLTIGEWALLVNTLFLKGKAQLELVRMEGWERGMLFAQTGLPWVMPSPNLPTPDTALLYPGTCLLEGTNVSTGRGTTRPFEIFGAPWVDPLLLARELTSRNLAGLHFRETYFKPTFDRFAGQVCGGVQVHLTENSNILQIVRAGLEIIAALLRLYPNVFEWQPAHFDRLIGSENPRLVLSNSAGDFSALRLLFQEWEEQEQSFIALRRNFLVY